MRYCHLLIVILNVLGEGVVLVYLQKPNGERAGPREVPFALPVPRESNEGRAWCPHALQLGGPAPCSQAAGPARSPAAAVWQAQSLLAADR